MSPIIQPLVSLLLSTLAVAITAHVLSGVHVESFWVALVVAVILGVVNALILPLLLLITLPINVLTLGLFTFVIIGALVMLVTAIVPGFQVDSFGWAMVFAVVLAVINAILKAIF
jgi:putative membrane protein